MIQVINLTPHSLNLNGVVIPAPEKGKEVRVEMNRYPKEGMLTPYGFVRCFLPIAGELTNVPQDVWPDEILVVSALAKAEILRRRPEWQGRVASPGAALRDSEGKVIGADGLDF